MPDTSHEPIEPVIPPTRLPQPSTKNSKAESAATEPSHKARVVFTGSTSGQIHGIGDGAKDKSKGGCRKSQAVLAGRARRSSAWARRKSLAFDQYEVDRVRLLPPVVSGLAVLTTSLDCGFVLGRVDIRYIRFRHTSSLADDSSPTEGHEGSATHSALYAEEICTASVL